MHSHFLGTLQKNPRMECAGLVPRDTTSPCEEGFARREVRAAHLRVAISFDDYSDRCMCSMCRHARLRPSGPPAIMAVGGCCDLDLYEGIHGTCLRAHYTTCT